jgi:hypothetical protein
MSEEPTRKEAAECLRDLGNRKFESLVQAQQYLEQLQEAVMQLVPQVGGRLVGGERRAIAIAIAFGPGM